jgi:hypothetical protein
MALFGDSITIDLPPAGSIKAARPPDSGCKPTVKGRL